MNLFYKLQNYSFFPFILFLLRNNLFSQAHALYAKKSSKIFRVWSDSIALNS